MSTISASSVSSNSFSVASSPKKRGLALQERAWARFRQHLPQLIDPKLKLMETAIADLQRSAQDGTYESSHPEADSLEIDENFRDTTFKYLIPEYKGTHTVIDPKTQASAFAQVVRSRPAKIRNVRAKKIKVFNTIQEMIAKWAELDSKESKLWLEMKVDELNAMLADQQAREEWERIMREKQEAEQKALDDKKAAEEEKMKSLFGLVEPPQGGLNPSPLARQQSDPGIAEQIKKLETWSLSVSTEMYQAYKKIRKEIRKKHGVRKKEMYLSTPVCEELLLGLKAMKENWEKENARIRSDSSSSDSDSEHERESDSD